MCKVTCTPRQLRVHEAREALFKQLLTLKKQFALTDRARELQVTRLYNKSLFYSDNEPVIKWLDNYQQSYQKSHGIRYIRDIGV